MVCEKHGWRKKKLPCPYLLCPRGARGSWIAIGKRKKVVYVRQRDKDAWGPRYYWKKTDLDPMVLLYATPDDEEEDILF